VPSENPSDEHEPDTAELTSAADEDFSMAFDRDMAKTQPAESEAAKDASAHASHAETKTTRKEAVPVAPSSTPLTFAPANDDQQRVERGRAVIEQRQPRTLYWATTALST